MIKNNIKKIQKKYYDNFYLLVFVTNICNYHCTYCYNKKEINNTFIDFDDLKRFIFYINECTQKKIDLNLIGGEPTLHPKLIEFLKEIKDINFINVYIFTNLSSSEIFLREMMDTKAKITASWHNENNHFIEKVNIIKDNIKDIIVMFEHDNQMAIDVYNNLSSLQCYIELAVIIGEQYTQKELNFLKNIISKNEKKIYTITDFNGNDYKMNFSQITMQNIKFKKWLCDAGKNYLYIHSNGEIYPCESYYSENKKSLGNIKQKTYFNIFLRQTICDCDNCSGDFAIQKINIFNQKNEKISNTNLF